VPETSNGARIARCVCGSVAFRCSGAPIVCVVCYCDDCQLGSRRIEALPGASPVMDVDGGTAYVMYRKDRFHCTAGAELLKAHKVRDGSATNRVVAVCCHSAMMLSFDDSKWWVSVYRPRFEGALPPLQMRVCTRFKPVAAEVPKDVPSYPGFPAKFLAKQLAARMAMVLLARE